MLWWFWITEDIEEWARKDKWTCSRGFSEQLAPCEEKGERWKVLPCDQFKIVFNHFIAYLLFKMEGLSHLKHVIQKEGWMCKLDFKHKKSCQNLSRTSLVSLKNNIGIDQGIGLNSSTTQTLELATIQLRFFQYQQIVCLRYKNEQSASTNIVEGVCNGVWILEKCSERERDKFTRKHARTTGNRTSFYLQQREYSENQTFSDRPDSHVLSFWKWGEQGANEWLN